MKDVASFRIHYTQFLDPAGVPAGSLPDFAREPAVLIDLYRGMVAARQFDKKAIAMQRTGQLGTYASCLGQEAIGAGIGHAMRPEDVLLPSYRDQAAQFPRGVRMAEILLYWGGDERGMDYARCREDFPICVPVASQCCHAVGVAYAFKYRGEARAAVCIVGDGGTSKGDFYEALNAAGIWRLPVVFVINNNQWAISVPRAAQTAAQTLAQKAIAAGLPGEQVDGNDVIAVRYAVDRALEKARRGDGPSLIEALSYRMGDHTTADNASRYRSAEEVERYGRADPIARLRAYLLRAADWREEDDARLERSVAAEVEQAVRNYAAMPVPSPETMFAHLYAAFPRAYSVQRETAGCAGK
ncbi:MAG: pyruvate dehydrogenase (acetyl-transferring) E1 component subunit alpha [Gammaproteobacteria bacterium]